MRKKRDIEPTFESACQSWKDIPNIWTPIGWKDHLFRFNILWNGAIFAQPHLNDRTEQWSGQGVTLTFVPMQDVRNALAQRWPVFVTQDDGMVRQGWCDGDAPVLWSEWPAEGLLMRSEIFGHIPGGSDVKTGVEPLFAWVRLRVHDALRSLPLEKEAGIILRINAPRLTTSMDVRGHRVDYPPYPRALRPHSRTYSSRTGLRLEEGGMVRLAIPPRQKCSTEFISGANDSDESLLFIRMPARIGSHVDLLVPMLPTARTVFKNELALGRDKALRQANAYWRRRPATAATFRVPEEPINEAIRHSIKFAEVVAEKNPADGQRSMLTGSLTYANLWATPHSMTSVMTLDTMGYHSVVEKYLEIFRREQGTVIAPGDDFQLHPGYLSSPKTLTAVDWLSDHGALLYTISEHALLSGNADFVKRWTDAIVKACEFIQYARSIRGHGGVDGLLPPAVANDLGTRIQALWNDGWNYKGLFTAVRLLRRMRHKRAEEFAVEASRYRRVFRAAFRRKAASMPVWTDAGGRKRRLCPMALYGDAPRETRHAFYLDTGPLFCVYAGLMKADDPLMRSALLWFREGPQTAFFRRDSNCWQTPCLDHEMSSCEPCYSWNVFHSHQLADRQSFLTAMYSMFAGAMSRKTCTLCETRGGITGLTPACLPIWMARLAVIDDQVAEDELHLLRFLPLAWCQPGKRAIFRDMPTEFGPVSLELGLSRNRARFDVSFRPVFRHRPRKVILHLPRMKGLQSVYVNGQAVASGKDTLLLRSSL